MQQQTVHTHRAKSLQTTQKRNTPLRLRTHLQDHGGDPEASLSTHLLAHGTTQPLPVFLGIVFWPVGILEYVLSGDSLHLHLGYVYLDFVSCSVRHSIGQRVARFS